MLSLDKRLKFSNYLAKRAIDWLPCEFHQHALYPLQYGQKSAGFVAHYIWAWVPQLSRRLFDPGASLSSSVK